MSGTHSLARLLAATVTKIKFYQDVAFEVLILVIDDEVGSSLSVVEHSEIKL